MKRHPGKIAVTALTLVLLTGCGGNSSSTPDVTGPSSGATSSPTADPSTGDPTSSVTPATGHRLDVEGFSIRAPEGFDQELSALARTKGIADAKTGDQITVAWVTSIGQVPLTEAIRLARRNTIGGEELKRLPDVEFAGETFYRLAGRIDRFQNEEYGAIIDGSLCFVRFQLTSSSSDLRAQIVASTMASFAPR